jgi:hypothetical protein
LEFNRGVDMTIVIILIAIEVFIAIVAPILIAIHSTENDYEYFD